jgi:hypothetical protein
MKPRECFLVNFTHIIIPQMQFSQHGVVVEVIPSKHFDAIDPNPDE